MRKTGRQTLKRILIDHIAPLLLPESTVVKRHGVRFRLHLRDDIQFGIFWGYYDRSAYPLLRSLVRPGGLCIDVGANIGYWTLGMSKLVGGSGNVYSFEPDPSVRQQLVQNIALNAFADNVVVRPEALSSAAGAVSFNRADVGHHSGWGSIERFEDIVQSQTVVQCKTFDEFRRESEIDYVDLMKIDVEGHEPRVIAGMHETLIAGRVGAIIIEINAPRLRQVGASFDSVLAQLQTFGYAPTDQFNGILLRGCLERPTQRQNVCSNFLFRPVRR
jgi:FkbM family methyltransferase